MRTSVIPTANALSGGCNAADAISHAEAAINNNSLNAAATCAIIAGNRLNFIERDLPKLACAEFRQDQSQSLIHVEDAALGNAPALEPDLI